LRIREDKPALQNLLQKGSVGDDLWNSLLAAEKELEAEIVEVVAEANSFVEGWGQVIFPTANEMLANEKMRAVFERTNEVKAEIEDKFELRSKSSASQALPSAATTKPGNALSPPQQGTESIVSSDGEGSSKPGKKIKKRK